MMNCTKRYPSETFVKQIWFDHNWPVKPFEAKIDWVLTGQAKMTKFRSLPGRTPRGRFPAPAWAAPPSWPRSFRCRASGRRRTRPRCRTTWRAAAASWGRPDVSCACSRGSIAHSHPESRRWCRGHDSQGTLEKVLKHSVSSPISSKFEVKFQLYFLTLLHKAAKIWPGLEDLFSSYFRYNRHLQTGFSLCSELLLSTCNSKPVEKTKQSSTGTNFWRSRRKSS